MSALERFVIGIAIGVLLIGVGWIYHRHAVEVARDEGDRAGYARAVELGNARYEAERDNNLVRERALREQLAARDTAAMKQEQTHAENLAAARRRVLAGTDVLRCPASALSNGATTADRPAAGGAAPDGAGAAIVPEVAADILGDAAAAAGIVRKFDRVVERFDECRALNNGSALAE